MTELIQQENNLTEIIKNSTHLSTAIIQDGGENNTQIGTATGTIVENVGSATIQTNHGTIHIANAIIVNHHYHYHYYVTNGHQIAEQQAPPQEPMCDYFNVIVCNDIDFTSVNAFSIARSRVFENQNEYEVTEQFSDLTEHSIQRLKKFPTLFANENRKYGFTDDSQVLAYGYIEHIEVRGGSVWITPRYGFHLKQQQFNVSLAYYGLYTSYVLNELNRTHWAVKKLNLEEQLQKAGVEEHYFLQAKMIAV